MNPVSNEEEALGFLKSVREKNREATHNVYAYRIKNNNISRYSDDGEPGGTAGLPLLDVFIKQEVFDFCCVATRYFGGTLLGAGGLVRAYARCGALALETSGTGLMRGIMLCAATLPYPLYETVKRLLKTYGAVTDFEDFGAEIALKFSLPSEDVPTLQKSVTESTAGAVKIHTESVTMGVFHATD